MFPPTNSCLVDTSDVSLQGCPRQHGPAGLPRLRQALHLQKISVSPTLKKKHHLLPLKHIPLCSYMSLWIWNGSYSHRKHWVKDNWTLYTHWMGIVKLRGLQGIRLMQAKYVNPPLNLKPTHLSDFKFVLLGSISTKSKAEKRVISFSISSGVCWEGVS